jgi:hypothetical protein
MTPKFEFKGKFYELKEPSIELWNRLMSIKDWTDEVEFSVKLISELCNLTEEEVKNNDWEVMIELSKSLSNYILQDSKKFHKEFDFEGQKYKFIDLPNLTFGEFIDIDTFLNRTTNERLKDTHLLMAMFYREIDDNGKLAPYDSSQLEKRAEKEKQQIIGEIDRMSRDKRKVELTMKSLGMGKWAAGGSKSIRKYDAERYEVERAERTAAGITDYQEGPIDAFGLDLDAGDRMDGIATGLPGTHDPIKTRTEDQRNPAPRSHFL